MSVIKLTLVICDFCGETFANGDDKQKTATQQRADYKSDGWHYYKGEDFCSDCKEK